MGDGVGLIGDLSLPDGLVAVVKRDCPTCRLVAPVLDELAAGAGPLTVFSQDDPTFPPGLGARHDDALEVSYRLQVTIVPTLLRVAGGRETARAEGWHRGEWEAVAARRALGAGLPAARPGCGSRSVEPGIAEELAARFGDVFRSRRIEAGPLEDEAELLLRAWLDRWPARRAADAGPGAPHARGHQPRPG